MAGALPPSAPLTALRSPPPPVLRYSLGASYGPTAADCSVRLVGGVWAHEGRVEVFHDGQWGTVCDDGFSNIDARVVCRHLGFGDSREATARSSAYFGAGRGRVWMDQVRCRGSENRLLECAFNGWDSAAAQRSNHRRPRFPSAR